MADPGGAGEANNEMPRIRKAKRKEIGKRWYKFRLVTPTSAVLSGTRSMNDKRFKYRSRGRQAAPCSVVAIVYGRLFEPKEWCREFIDQILEYGDKLFRISVSRNHVKDNEYMKTDLVFPEFYMGNYKIMICAENTGISGNLFSETVGCPDFADGLRRFFQAHDAGVVTAQGRSVAMWRHLDRGFMYFEAGPCDEYEITADTGTACLMSFKCMNDMRDHFLAAIDKSYDSRYCIDKITVLRVNPVGGGYVNRVPSEAQLVVDQSVIKAINPVDIDENKMDCTKPVPKDRGVKIITEAKIKKEPLLITISNYSIDKAFATDPLVQQDKFDTGYHYHGMHVNVPSTFRELPGRMAILHGMTHETSEVYKGKGAQNVANCVMAFAMKKVHPVKTWMRPILDQILVLGDALYAEVRAERPTIKNMTASDLNDRSVEIENRNMIIEVDLITVTGTIISKVPSVLNLKEALEEFFLLNSEGIIESPGMAVAIWSQDDCYYSFDPRQSDGLGSRVAEEKGGKKGGKGGQEEKKIQGKSCVIRFPDTDSLALLFFKNIDPSKRNERFTIRHITIYDDITGTRPWHEFKPGLPGKSWVLRGSIANDDENLEEESRGVQGLAMPVVALAVAKETPPPKLITDKVDEIVRGGDAYYNWCNPVKEGEEVDTEKPFLVPDLKKHFYLNNRKVKFEIDESVIVGDLSSSADNKDMPNLETGLAEFFQDHQFALLDMKNLKAAVWKVEEESKKAGKDKDDKKEQAVDIYYYYFDSNPRNKYGLNPEAKDMIPTHNEKAGEENEEAAEEVDDEGRACIIRAPNLSELAKMILANAEADFGSSEEADIYGKNDYAIHEIRNINFGQPMTEEELEEDKKIPIKPENNNYVTLSDAGSILTGSFQQGNEAIFKRQTRNKQQSANSLVALAMTKLYNPHLWYREVLDDILKLGDKITEANLENLPEPEGEEGEESRQYLLPSEIGEEITVGVNKMLVSLDEEMVSGKTSDLATSLEGFFEANSMGVFRQGANIIAIWKEGNVYFMMDPKGRDGRGEPRAEKDGTATVMWFTDIASLADMIKLSATEDDFVIDNATLENAYETRVPQEERLKKTASEEELWHHFPKLEDGVWSISGNTAMDDERFEEEHRNNQTAAIAVMAIVFSKVYDPPYWTSDILDEVIVTGDRLHTICIERLGGKSVPRVNEIITEFFLSNRRIDLTMKDCVEAGDLSGRPPKIQDLQSGVDKFFKRFKTGVLTAEIDRNIAMWKVKTAFYCLIPDWISSPAAPKVLRFINTNLLVDYLLRHLGREGDYEFTAVDVADQNTYPPWRFDPSPAVRPSNLPTLNAYRKTNGEARAILRGSYHQGDEIFPEDLRNKQTAANCVVALGMAVIKNPITWTKRTMDEIMSIGCGVHRETKKAKPTKVRLKPWDIIRIFYVGVNILTADIESSTVTGQVAIPTRETDDKKAKKGRGGKRKAKATKGKKGRGTSRVRAPPAPPILLEAGLRKFFETNRAGILVTDRGMAAIWKDLGVYFMYDPRARSDQGLPDFYGTSCTMWFACIEPLYDVIFANIDEQEKYGPFEICKVIIKTAMIEPLPCPAGFRSYFDCTAPPIPIASLKKTTTLAVETVTDYTTVDEELSVLRGTLHMSHRTFSVVTRGYQSTAIAAVAIVVALLHVPSTWTPELTDAILKYGDLLHGDTIRSVRPGARNLSPSELLTVFIVGDFRACIHIHNHTTAGVLHTFDLSEALALFFRTNCAGILHTTNIAVAVMQHYGKFYLFDPCSRNDQGMPSFEGAACVMKCETIMKMASMFVRNCNLKKPNVYTLNAVNVLSLCFFSDAKSGCATKCEQ
ncbi:uncharacterized protein [Prorops nasuta]|uniref:uncharacterized protein n=1 Tax=Prorops nasuta TaxID=863751 RepID=UPI0034CF8254